jgi:glycosyltransferase involved in cell wall biosynthesis
VTVVPLSSAHAPRLRGLIYGDVDLNLLDGSSIWLVSLVQTLSRGEVDLTVLLKAPIQRELLIEPLRAINGVRPIDPREVVPSVKRRLSVEQAVDALVRMHRDGPYGFVLLRGFALCRHAAAQPELRGRLWCYVTDIPQRAEELDDETRAALAEICEASQFILCQTDALRGHLEAYVPAARRRTAMLPPMLPPIDRPSPDDDPPAARTSSPRATQRPRRIVYAGKLAPMYTTRELVEAFARMREQAPDLELHVYGDKIHNPPDLPDYQETMRALLEQTEGLVWHGGRPRDEVLAALPEAGVAWSWRHRALDDSLELSTKILEYGSAGLPVVLNRTEQHERLLGADYPLFASNLDEALAALRLVWSEPALAGAAAERTRRAAQGFEMPAIFRRHLSPLLERAARPDRGALAKTVLIAGHDLRFIAGIGDQLERAGHRIVVDKWTSHVGHDEGESLRLLEEADVVICEWCLGNAVWYSHHKRKGQRLLVRFHLQERDTEHPAGVDLSAVDRVIFISPQILEEARDRFGWDDGKLVLVPNYVDGTDLDRPKLPGAELSLGIAGICPARKRLDLALDIVERLRLRDRRFSLRIKGKRPEEYDWLWRRPEEREYYEAQWARLRHSPLLSEGVRFEGYGDDMGAWYQTVGFLLSTSDFEGSHVCVAEGARSGGVPIVFPWEGADRVYPAEWVVHSVDEAVNRIWELLASGTWDDVRRAAQEHARREFDVVRIARAWRELIA